MCSVSCISTYSDYKSFAQSWRIRGAYIIKIKNKLSLVVCFCRDQYNLYRQTASGAKKLYPSSEKIGKYGER